MPPYTGIAQFVKYFEDPKTEPPPPPTPVLTKEERRAKKRKERLEQEMEKIREQLKSWDPYSNPKATDDAFKTLFVGRISYKTTEHKLKREFEQYGPIRSVRMVYDLDGKPRGYAFIEYERERDMRTAFKEGDAKKIDGRRVLVDVERGRTVKGWKPRRFGGGLGGTRIGSERDNIRHSGRGPPSRERSDRDFRRDDRDRDPAYHGSRERDRENRGERDRKRSRDDREERDDRTRVRTEPRHEEHRERRERDRDRGERDRDRDRERERERDPRERDERRRSARKY
jgi:U1 small nuclear ribonucleoprotein